MSINSLFIPHVFQNIDEGKIREVFNVYGPIKDIRFVPKVGADAHKYNAVFIHFEEWNEAQETNALLEELGNNGKTHVYYDEQWYWIVLFNTSKSNKDKDKDATTTTTTAMKKVKVLVKEKAPVKEEVVTTTATPITPTGTSSLPANANWAPKKVKKETTKETAKETTKETTAKETTKRNLDTEFEKSNNNNNNHDEADTEDFTLVDASYVFNLEEENKNLRMEIQRLMTQQQGYMNLIRQQAGVMANMTSMPMSPMSMFGGSSFNPNAY